MTEPKARDFALWELGFRPFFLLGLLAAALLLGAWLWVFTHGQTSASYFELTLWHAHEMVFGFAMAVVIGFLFTASQNWTNKPGIKGGRLMLLAGLWVAARILLALPIVPDVVTAAVDMSFLPLAALFLFPYLGQKGQRRNFVFLVLLAMLTAGNAAMHLGALDIRPGFERQGVYLALHVVILMIIVISGRIIPMFSERTVPGYQKKDQTLVDRGAIASAAAFAVAAFVAPSSAVAGYIAAAAAMINLWRWLGWHHRGVWRMPILGILYVGYAWVIIGFAMAFLATALPMNTSAVTHAFTVGAIGTMIIAMISRVSLGHTGRPIIASKTAVAAYGFVTAAALIRVFGPLVVPDWLLATVQVSGVLWIAAFVLMLIGYGTMLLHQRVDGRPG